MCGIWFRICDSPKYDDLTRYVELLKHRGPDSYGFEIFEDGKLIMIHTRLHINGDSTPQPIVDKENDVYLIMNGEIFNWKELEQELNFTCKASDCEIILPLYQKYKKHLPSMLNRLNGQFSFVLYDKTNQVVFSARDRIGVTPLYMGKDDHSFVFTSELKAIPKNLEIEIFKPRQFVNFKTDNWKNMVFRDYVSFDNIIGTQRPKTNTINKLLVSGVKRQLQDVLFNKNADFGVLLSGGLDSSLIASLVTRLAKEMGYNQKIKTFSIGISDNSPDIKASKKVGEYLDTEHYTFYYSIDQGIKSLREVIWYTETYDCTTVRASTPMYLLTKQIHEKFPELKILFSGELSDELLCYLYGANAPDDTSFQKETIKLVNDVHQFDCLRANKTCMANQIEVRVPFTDPDYVDYILNIKPEYKRFGQGRGIEKKILRDSFRGYLPDKILYRKKEQFSDGVSGYNKGENWIDSLKEHCEKILLTPTFEKLKKEYTINQPRTREELYYRMIFSELFTNKTAQNTVKVWKPNWSTTFDPSGRVQNFWCEN
jgi:asparagine synthase (glutamine-hydrolysing)